MGEAIPGPFPVRADGPRMDRGRRAFPEPAKKEFMHAGLKTWISAMAVAAAVCLTAAGQAGAYYQAHLDQLLKTGRCALCNLSHADLYRADLKGADINGSNLYLTDLEGPTCAGPT